MGSRLVLLALVGLGVGGATLSGCGAGEPSASTDTGISTVDVGVARDALAPDDVGVARDAGAVGDAATDAEVMDAAVADLDAEALDSATQDAFAVDAFAVDAFAVDAAAPLDASLSCPAFGPSVELAHVADPGLFELSGLVASRLTPGILFAHNDEAMDLYAVRAVDGAVRGHWTLRSGGSALGAGDVEDIAIAPLPSGGSAIYLGDIGGGSSTLRIARVPEPVVPLTGPAASGSLDAELMRVTNLLGLAIPNAETLLVDPLDGTVVIVQKAGSAHPCVLGRFADGTTVTPDCAAPAVAGITNPSAGDVSPDGRFVIVRNETVSYLWVRPPGGTLVSAFGGLRCPFSTLEHRDECNGEAIGFAADGLGLFTASEQGGCSGTHVHSYTLTP